jgi:hypothetical protein
METYKLHFRYRDDNNKLSDEVKKIQATSAKRAEDYGKKVEAERDKYWFMGLV